MPVGIVAKHPVKTIEENIVNPNFMVNDDLFFIFIFCLLFVYYFLGKKTFMKVLVPHDHAFYGF